MSVEFNTLISAFKTAIDHKEDGSFEKKDVDGIYKAASKVFNTHRDLSQDQVMQLRDLWVKLAEGKIDKSRAMKKLQGTSRAEAIRAVLQQIV